MQYKNFVKLLLFSILFFLSFTTFAANGTETLNEAYFAMLNTNPELFSSEANQQAAWQSYLQLRGGYLPTVGVGYNVGRGKGISVSPQTTNIGYTVENIQHKILTVSQLLFDGGALVNRVASAKSKYESAYFQTILHLNQLALRSTAAYLALLRSQEMERIANANVQRHKFRLNQANERYKGGVGTISELALTRTRLEEAELVWNKSRLEVENAKSVYLQVIGHLPSSRLIVPNEPSHYLPSNLTEAERFAHQVNPTLLASQALIQSARHEYEANKSVLYWPNVSLQLSASRDNNLQGIEQKVVSMQGYLALTYNLFNGGADLANMRKSAELLNASQADLETKRREIALAIEQTWHELQMSKQDQQVLIKRLASSKEVVDVFGKEMLLGKRSLFDVMESENESYNVQTALVDTKYKIKIDAYTLLATSGLLSDYLCGQMQGKA